MKGAQFVVQSNLKIMSRSIAALSKISEDVLIEVSEGGLFFKTVNRSKFCVFRFAPEFFNACDVSMINKKAVNICRLSMKSAQRIFKGVAFGEKNFVGCEFRIDPKAERMMVKLQMNYDIERTIHAKLREMGSMLHKPTYNRSGCRNITVVFASTLLPIFVQMKGDIEVTMKVTDDGLTIRNFHSLDGVTMFNMGVEKGAKKVKTETTITCEKLTRHKIQIPVEFSFSIKEFLSIVTFADQLGSEVCMYYDLPGKPLIVSIEAHPNFDIELALATMGSDDEIDLDGGILKETMAQHEEEEDKSTAHSSSSRRKSKAIDTSSSGTQKSKKCSESLSQEETTRSQSLPSRNRFVPEIPVAEQSWRDREVTVYEQREPSPDLQIVEEVMEIDNQPIVTRTIKEEHSVEQAMQDVSIETIPVETPEENIIPVEVEMLEEPEQEDQEIFKIPQPKRRKTAEDDRNRKIRRILMGTETTSKMRMSQQFDKRLGPLVSDTQYESR
ncbi:Cell cycle checkpoint control protein [Caenorhabditis elegans]|nr:Cell cycle checkpoint control protein [Caenorhabditis elegans]CEM99533.1 Cell cycle checkpoint control protein [Caenorhabditis elegans]|eukprot:NP_001338804.1 Cell cycle checkpoint protein hpr-9 [Caenorhabditis elegans]